MTVRDIPAGMRLKELAGWNQTQEDWERFLAANPEGCFVAEVNGQVAGTAATIIYENRFAWIGMVLVDPAERGKGIGTALLERAIQHLEAKRIPCMKLDATPQGKPIYERLGFQVEYEIERQSLTRDSLRPGPPVAAAGASPNHHAVFGAAEAADSLLALDREVFGADRSALLRSVARGAPALVAVVSSRGAVEGFALARQGSLADHLGPWVASNGAAARRLLETFLVRSLRPVVFVDVLRDNPWAPALLAASGFKFSRTLTRMYRGENAHPGRPDFLCAILGPEFG
ncbi:MAG TPA: GNAT family N-acetyltransferase [Candidatus Acidoferrales bacterium]|nr:GNAT family N-acetyltransferase [Candidatus Acidoferrales bacterium]